ncbi:MULTISPECIES: type II CAAX endopeptidase family protein [unclassified Leptolyngbya]|nr:MULTISPECIES: type II CAAX endopeptidase family protein [unclassified Leptolyngbya]
MKLVTPKRLILAALTVMVVALVGSSLLGSLEKPQITNRLELYQTNLILSATGMSDAAPETEVQAQLREAVLGKEPLKTAQEDYQEVRESVQTELNGLQTRLKENPASEVTTEGAPTSEILTLVDQQRRLLAQLDLQIGLLQAEQGEVNAAQQTWEALSDRLRSPRTERDAAIARTTKTVQGLWNQPPNIEEDASSQIETTLEGWFRAVSLERLYEVQQNSAALTALEGEQEAIAQQTLLKLAVIGVLPGIAAVTGIGLFIFLVIQRITRGKEAILSFQATPWETPWTWETVWQVLIVGFFFMGQIVVPLLLSLLHLTFTGVGSSRVRAVYTLVYYLTMASSALLVLFFSIRSHRPLPDAWFRYRFQSNWPLWGVGGYLVALPLMLGVSLVNQQFWQGQGGSNPLLQIVLEENDPLALGLFLFTAAIAAPIFEETLFRGFLLPSLTRYLPASGAIALSSLIFAIAHLSLSEVLPLTALGAILGFVYVRSRNLLAPILLHCLWNSITMIGLFILGSGTASN